MANAVIVSIVLVLALQARGGEAWPWASEACEQPGAVREERDGAVSVCVVGEGWRYVPTPTWSNLTSASTRADPNCTGSGGLSMCDTACSALGLCLADGSWMSLGECGNDMLCVDGECQNSNSVTCPSVGTIKCEESGNYPNLVNCSLYYECVVSGTTTTVYSMECGSGLVYDACTGECDVELPAGEECSWAQSSPCEVAGTLGVAPNNDRLYYICAIDSTDGSSYQYWRKCTTGHFNVTSKSCVNATELGCGSNQGGGDSTSTAAPTTVPTPIETTTEPNTPTTTTTEPNPPTTTTSEPNPPTTTTSTTTSTQGPSFECTTPGVAENPDTNCSFYYCYPDLTYMVVTCLDGYYYDPSTGGCSPGQCT